MEYEQVAADNGTPFMQLSIDAEAAGTTGFEVYDEVTRRYTKFASHLDRPPSLDLAVDTSLHHPAVEEAEASYEEAKDVHTDADTVRERFETGIDILKAYRDCRDVKSRMEQGDLDGTYEVMRLQPEEPGIPLLSLDGAVDHEYVAVAGEERFELYLVDTTSGEEPVQEPWRGAFIENAAAFLEEEYGDEAVTFEPAF